MKETVDKVDLFWTGGWDSTFRLVQLLMTTGSMVQPHYIVRSEDVTGIEISTMIKIRRAIVRTYPEVDARFLPTIYTNEDLITRHEDIKEQVEKIRAQVKVNEQYHILADYCRERNIAQAEVSLVQYPGMDAEERLSKQFMNAPAFKSFTFPVIHLSKTDMDKIAREQHWEEIMYLSSFCRRPPKSKPCGVCGPCTDAVIRGMGFRLPFSSRMKAKLLIPFRKYWRNNYEKNKNKRFFRLIERKLVHRL
jgi:7-cyano-7-deazaguanine synthase in queuosine biosynthesis